MFVFISEFSSVSTVRAGARNWGWSEPVLFEKASMKNSMPLREYQSARSGEVICKSGMASAICAALVWIAERWGGQMKNVSHLVNR